MMRLNAKSIKNTLTVLSLMSAGFASAQVNSIGLKAGLNYSNISGYYPFISSYKTGLVVGGFVDYGFTDHVFIELQALYEQKGYKYELQDFTNKIRIYGSRDYDYFTLPFLFKYKFGNVIRINIKLGTYLGLLLNAREEEIEYDYSVSPPDIIYKRSSIMHKTTSVDMGFSFGFGLERNITKKSYLLFGALLNSGFMLIEPDKIFIEETRNKSFALSFGIGHYL